MGTAPLKSKGDSEDDEEEELREESPPRPAPAVVTPIAARRAPALEYSAMAAENDEDKGRTTSPNHAESRPPATTPTPAPRSATAEPNVQYEAESSSTSGEASDDGG
jgi:hypothetical protein